MTQMSIHNIPVLNSGDINNKVVILKELLVTATVRTPQNTTNTLKRKLLTMDSCKIK